VIDERLIRIVVEEVLRAMAASRQPPRRLLVILTGAPADTEQLAAGLRPLGAHNFRATLLLSHTAARQPQASRLAELPFVESAITEYAAPSALRLAFDADAVVVPWLSLNTAAKLVVGVNDTAVSTALILALLRGIPVVACIDEFDPDGARLRAWARPAPALVGWLRTIRERLESFGVRLAGPDRWPKPCWPSLTLRRPRRLSRGRQPRCRRSSRRASPCSRRSRPGAAG